MKYFPLNYKSLIKTNEHLQNCWRNFVFPNSVRSGWSLNLFPCDSHHRVLAALLLKLLQEQRNPSSGEQQRSSWELLSSAETGAETGRLVNRRRCTELSRTRQEREGEAFHDALQKHSALPSIRVWFLDKISFYP